MNLQVGASADDGSRYGATLNVTVTTPTIGNVMATVYEHFCRWTGVTISGTIDASYIECYAHANGDGTPLLKVRGVDEDNPPAPTTAAEYNADPLTDAGVDWDGAWTINTWEQTASLNTIFQELVDTYTIDNEAVMVQLRDDGSESISANTPRHWDYAGNAHGAKLHIDYTAGGVTTRRYGLTVLGVG